MKKQVLLLPILLLCACRTTAEPKENDNSAKPANININLPAEVLLRKYIGRLPKEENKSQYYDCKVMSTDVSDPASIRKLITEIPPEGKMTVAYYIRANEPSDEVVAYLNGKEIILRENYSQFKVHKDSASNTLIELADEKCPGPK